MGDGFVAVGAVSSVADALTKGVAVGAVLVAEVALVADWTGVDGGWSDGSWRGEFGDSRGVSLAVGGLSAGVGAPASPADRDEVSSAF